MVQLYSLTCPRTYYLCATVTTCHHLNHRCVCRPTTTTTTRLSAHSDLPSAPKPSKTRSNITATNNLTHHPTNKHPQFTLLNKRRCPLGRCQRNRLAGHHAQNAQEAAAGARGAQGGCGTRIHVHMVTCLNRQYYRHTPILHSTNAARHAARKCPTARTDQVRRCRLDRLMLVPWMLRVRITVWTLEQQLF